MKRFELSKIYRGCKDRGRPSMKKDWNITYYLNGKRIQTKRGINYGKTIQERERLANEVKEEIDELLIANYKNWKENKDKLPIRQWMDWALNLKRQRIKESSIKEYATPLNIFYRAAEKLKYINLDLTELTRVKMMEILQQMITDRNGGGALYHKYKTNLFSLFKILVDYEKITINPCDFKAEMKEPKKKKVKTNEIFTGDQVQAIYNKIKTSRFPGFINYLSVLNMTGIRPVELFRLRVDNIDLAKGTIFIPAEETKDVEDRIVPIPTALRPYIEQLQPGKYAGHYFLFGFNFVPEERNLPVKRDHATKLWNDLVKQPPEKGGLGFNLNMYWLKHKGMYDRREAGVSAEAVQLGVGHADYNESIGYMTLERPTNISELIDKTPDIWK